MGDTFAFLDDVGVFLRLFFMADEESHE